LAINYINDADLGLSIDYKDGSLYSQLELNHVQFKQGGVDLNVSAFTLDLSLSCLFVGEVCLNKVNLDKVKLDLSDNSVEEEVVAKTENKLITLPILVSLNELRIGEIAISQQNEELLHLKRLLLALSFKDHLDISRFNIASLNMILAKAKEESAKVVTATASNKPRDWLNTLANYQYQPMTIPDVFIPIELSLRNAKLNNICIREIAEDDSISTLVCNDSLSLEAEIKKQKVDATIHLVNMNQGQSAPSFSPTDLQLNASVNFAKRFEHQLTLAVLNKDTPISGNPKGFEIKSQGNVNRINLGLTHLSTQQKILSANATIKLTAANLPLTAGIKIEELQAETAADIKAWLPMLSDELFEQLRGVSLLQINLGGDMQAYRLTTMLRTKGIMGVENAELNALFKPVGNQQSKRSLADIQKLTISGDIGTIDYSGKATLAPKAKGETELSFEGSLDLDSFKLSEVSSNLNSLVTGTLPHKFSITETTQFGAVRGANLSGTWQDLPLSIVANAELEQSGNILVEGIRLSQGENQINAQGNLYSSQALESMTKMGASFPELERQDDSSLDFTVDLVALGDIYPDLEGRVFAKGNVSGPIETPNIVIQGNAKELLAANVSVESASIDASVDMANKLSSTTVVSISNLYAGGQNIPQFKFELSGDESEQSLLLEVPEGDYITQQFFKGKLNADNTAWTGKWIKGSLVSSLAELSLQSEPEINLNMQPFSLFLENHCWEGRGDKLCVDDVNVTQQTAKTKISLDYNIMNQGIANLLPSFDIEKSDLDLNTDIEVDWQQELGLKFDADISATNATLVSNDNKVIIENIQAKVQGTPTSISSRFSFDSTQAGTVSLNSKLDLSAQPYQHQGNLVISEFAVSYFASFLTEIKKLNGDINADIVFKGPLEKPSLNGELTLADGALVLKAYPLRLTDYNQTVSFNGTKADFSGQFTLGEGKGSIEGDIDFSDALLANMDVVGDKLDVAYETYKFQVSPDLKIKLKPELLSVKGDVEVPYARVKIKTLPPSAKSPTQDIIVIDEKKEARQSSLPLDINVNVLIDKAKKGEVKLDALDLTADLSGDLNVQVDGENTRVNGIVQILKGDYEAYSQVLQIRKGDITFSGQPDVPAFDIEAIRNPLNTAGDVIAGIRVSGNAIKPSVALFSEPSMEQARQLSYLISGDDMFGPGSDPDESNMLVNALVSYGVGRSENGIGSLGQKLGVKDLNLQTAGQGSDTKVQLSGQLAEGVKITYGIGVFDSVSEVSVHYQLLPQLYLEAVSGVNNTLDLYYQITSKD
jgi:translocation and assembly module TamB